MKEATVACFDAIVQVSVSIGRVSVYLVYEWRVKTFACEVCVL